MPKQTTTTVLEEKGNDEDHVKDGKTRMKVI
jgi:hypothetical protein